MFSLVIPIGPQHDNLRRFCEIALPSYQRFLNLHSIATIHIVVPATITDQVSDYIHLTTTSTALANRIVVWTDEEVLNGTGVVVEDVPGWVRQQLIKLHIVSKITTKYYIPIDADHFLVHPLDVRDLIVNGRAVYSAEPWQTSNGVQYSQNSNWWTQSCALLQQPLYVVESDQHLMGVTPQILYSHVVRDLLAHLRQLYGVSYVHNMVANKFTEFTLYWIFIKQRDLADIHYTTNGTPLWQHDLLRNVLHPTLYTEYMHAQLTLAFTEPKTYFAVAQSYLGVPVDCIRVVTDKYLLPIK